MNNKPVVKPQASSQIMVLLFVAIIALLPFGRLAELPVLVLSIWGVVQLFKQFDVIKLQPWFKPLSYFYLGFLALTVISSVDSFWPEKSWLVSLSSLRFYLLAVVVLNHVENQYILSQTIKWVSVVMIVWGCDALVQAILGVNLLGMTSYPGRLTGVFGQNVKLGPTLALFLPVVLIFVSRFRPWLRWIAVALMVLVIVLSGTRSAWIMSAFVLMMFWWHHVKGRRFLLLIKAITLVGIGATLLWFTSTDFQNRVDRSVQLFQGDMDAVDFALADRLPIWKTALNMYMEHPVNGVGVHAFRKAYTAYAEANDVWVNQQGSGLHAHHWMLEILAETGTIGAIIMLLLIVLLFKRFNQLFQLNTVWPFAVSLMAALLPVISLYSLFSSYWSICLWWMLVAMFLGSKYDKS